MNIGEDIKMFCIFVVEMQGDSIVHRGEYGYYWTVEKMNNNKGYQLLFPRLKIDEAHVNYGRSIRAVYYKEKE